MSIAAPPEASRSITHFRCKKDFFYKVQYGVAEQRACIHSLYGYSQLNRRWQEAGRRLRPDCQISTKKNYER